MPDKRDGFDRMADVPVDPDIDLHVPDQRAELARTHGGVLAAIALGGALGSLGRYGLTEAIPVSPGGFPAGTFLVNVIGCLLIGVLMVLITEVYRPHPLVRPFLGVGVLGGFTTFSAYADEVRGLLRPEWTATGLAYLAGTVLAALAATWSGQAVTRLATRRTRTARPA